MLLQGRDLPTTSINQINSASSVSAPTQPMAMDKSKGKSMPSGDLNNRLDRLESLILTQHDDNNNFKTMVMNTLSIEPNTDDIDENQSYDYDQDYMDYEDVSDLSVPLGQEDPLLRQDHNISASDQPQGVQADTPLHRSSDISEQSLGFAARYASESLGPAIDGVIADSLTYMSSHQLVDKNLTEMMLTRQSGIAYKRVLGRLISNYNVFRNH